MGSIDELLRRTTEENESKTDWTKAWSGKYPVLKTYQDEVDVPSFAGRLRDMLRELRQSHGYSERDAMLVLKDILYHEYLDGCE